jgi:vacuolar-type H+-ATPase subunit I/STV1
MAIESLFGVSPEMLQAQQAAQQREQAMQFAQLSPGQASQFMAYQAGSGLGGALGGMMGAKDPELEKAAQVKSLIEGVDFEDTSSVMNAITSLNKAGFTREAMSLIPRVDKLKEAQANRDAKTEEVQMRIEAKKEEIRLRAENQTEQLKLQTQAALERAREQNASREMIAAMMADARRQAAQIAADARTQTAQLTAALKGEKPKSVAEVKAELDKQAKGDAVDRFSSELDNMDTMLDELYKQGGVPSTKDLPLKNIGAYASASSIGQVTGRMIGAETQATRDSLEAAATRLLADYKKATGMSASEMNSNVELQQFKNAMGSSTMSLEARKKILQDMRDKFVTIGKKKPPSSSDSPTPSSGDGWSIRPKK